MRRWCAILLVAVLCLFFLCWSVSAQGSDWEQSRIRMVREQLKARGIEDSRVLQAMREVRRHLFVPEDVRSAAYRDGPLPIGHGQTISQPYIVALMTQLASVDPGDRILEVGTGSGYQAAVLARLADRVYSVEIVEELAREARQKLKELGYDNVSVRIGDGFRGWPEHAPFDAIVVTCSPPEIPSPLKEQLAPGGRLIIPVGERQQELKVVSKNQEGAIEKESVIPVRFVPMTGPGVRQQGSD